MTLPPRIRIAGFDFAVTIESSQDFTDDLFGQIAYRPRRIRVSDRADSLQQRETLLHEVLHGVSDAYEAELTERQISVIGRGLYAAFRDNPDLAAFLNAE